MSQLASVSSSENPTERKTPMDCQPILERKGTDLWSYAARVCNELYESLQLSCENEGIKALVLKSEPYVYPMWVKFECWIPKEERVVTERASLVVTVTPKPFHRYPLEFELELNDRGKVKKYPSLFSFTKEDAAQLVSYLLRRSHKPSFLQHWFQLSKPMNKVNSLGTQGNLLINGLVILGICMIMSGVDSPLFFFGAISILAAIIVGVSRHNQEPVVQCPGKPEAEPRRLFRVDSWQAVISGLGEDTQSLRERFLSSLNPPFTKGFRYSLEQIWYWGLDGTVEREQLVLTLGRAIVFCQIYQYDQELYAGWDGHLNTGQWVEKNIAKGLDKKSGRLTWVNSVVPGYQPVTEYDITDLNCLIEWTHARLTKLIKELMEERKIDQEVDFQIQRGERQNLVQENSAGALRDRKGGPVDGGRGVPSKLRRTG
jgi:hypothetical protein